MENHLLVLVVYSPMNEELYSVTNCHVEILYYYHIILYFIRG